MGDSAAASSTDTPAVGQGKKVLVISNMRRDLAGWAESVALLRSAGFEVEDSGRTLEEPEIVERIADADAVLLVGSIRLSGDAIRNAKKARLISKSGIGVDTIDMKAATAAGILVCNTAGSNSESVADHAIALMLGLLRRVAQLDEVIRRGDGWKVWPPPVEQLAGKTLAIIGTGNIGSRVARRAAAGFGMRVLANDLVLNRGLEIAYGVHYAPLDEIIAAADVVSLHVPLTPQTYRMIDSRRLGLMRPSAILINTARGEIVDEAALVDALQDGRIGGAALDVFEKEPAVENPLFELNNVLLTPHSAGQSTESSINGRLWSAENIIAAFAGNPRNIVNGVAG